MKLPYYKTFKGADGQYYFTLYASNNQPISQSEGYTTIAMCKKGIRSNRLNAPIARVIDI